MANVKHTTNNGEILTTSCKRLSTALKRFTAFLKEYDRYYNEMLSELNSENTTVTRDTCDTETVTITLTNDTDSYTLTIKHDVKIPETVWSICTQDGVIKDFTDRKELFQYAYDNNLCGEFDDIWIEEKELKDSTHKYYETVDYESLDLYHVRSMLEFDICDMKINDTNTTESATAEQTAEQTKSATADYNCFSDVKLTGTKAQIKLATDTLNEHYKRLCNDISLEYKMRVSDNIVVESKDFYEHLNIFITILKKVLNGNNARCVIKNIDKFEICGNVYRTAMIFILAYNVIKSDWVIKYLENKIRRELKLQQ